jgi:hypothetical protein
MVTMLELQAEAQVVHPLEYLVPLAAHDNWATAPGTGRGIVGHGAHCRARASARASPVGCVDAARRCSACLEEVASTYAPRVHPLVASFIDLEGRNAGESLRQAALDRRYGKRTMSFNCFDVIIDADTAIVTLEDAIDLDGQRAVLSLNDLVRDLSS